VPRTFDVEREWDWVRVSALAGGDPAWVLATLAYLRHPDGLDGGPRGCSNGVAAGNTREEAILQGLLELVERDAVALWWYPRAERPAFDVASSHDPRVTAALAPLHRLGRDVWVLDVTSDLGIPAAAAFSALADGTRLLHGFGAHLDPVVAVVRALTEVAQMEAASLAAMDALKEGTSLEQQWVREVTTTTDPWLAPHGISPLAGAPVHRIDDAIATVVDRLDSAGLTAYWIDLTRRDLRLPVVRTFVPGLRHFWNRFAPGRLYDVPPKLGGVPDGYGEADLNPRWVFI
jgi:ribosomal protein S12 methylthiotransferase accessory factor